MYWKHFQKLNQIFEGLHGAAVYLFLTQEQVEKYESNNDRLYQTKEELSQLAIEALLERKRKEV